MEPNTKIVVVADKEWASLPGIAAFLGHSKDLTLGCAIIAGSVSDAGSFPGLKIVRDVKTAAGALKGLETYIPWHHVLAIFSAADWQTATTKKAVGFISEITKDIEKKTK